MRSAAFSVQQKEDMEKLSATNLVANLLASGEVSSIRSALRKKGLDKPIETAFRKMQIIQRNVRGSEAEKDNLLPKFSAMRLWSGCSSLFFTLNPHDIRSPLTILLLQNDVKFEKTFSLDLSDEATAEFMTSFLRENPRRLHQEVAGNQLAAMRCFHWNVGGNGDAWDFPRGRVPCILSTTCSIVATRHKSAPHSVLSVGHTTWRFGVVIFSKVALQAL